MDLVGSLVPGAAHDALAVARKAAAVPGRPVDQVLKLVLELEPRNPVRPRWGRGGGLVRVLVRVYWGGWEEANDADAAIIRVDNQRTANSRGWVSARAGLNYRVYANVAATSNSMCLIEAAPIDSVHRN